MTGSETKCGGLGKGGVVSKSPEAFRTISEVAGLLEVPQHVLRFWESKFPQVKPMKRGGGRRYYRPEDVSLLKGIRQLLYGEGYTIKGVQKILREQGARHVAHGLGGAASRAGAEPAAVVLDEGVLEAAQQASGLSREQVQVLEASLYELVQLQQLLKTE